MDTLKNFVARCLQEQRRFVVAHRGSSGTAPENTMSALREAVEAGVQMVEVDVRITADGKPILLHDHIIGRTTTGKGHTSNFTYEELRKLDAGDWFGKKYQGEYIPLLSEALAFLRDNNTFVNIEIKPPDPQENIELRIKTILDVVKQEQMLEQTLFGSFHHPSLALLKQIEPKAHTAAIQLPSDLRLPSEIANEINCEALVCSLKECTKKRSLDAKEHGLYLGVYTINTPEQLDLVLKHDVLAIVSNYPALIAEELRRRTI